MLVKRELEDRYKGSLLGNFWPLLTQLSHLLIYTYVFSIVLQVKLSLAGLPEDDSLIFGFWLFAGLVPWMAFTGGLVEASNTVVAQTNLVKKVVFPLSLLPLVPIFAALVESAFGLVTLIVLYALIQGTLHETLVFLPLVWMPQILFTTGLAYLTAALTVFLRDIPQTLSVIFHLWFYLTPIVYPPNVIPEQFQDVVFWVNPMAIITQLYRDTIIIGNVEHWGQLGVLTIISLLVFYGGFWTYQRLRPGFADVL
ncbi:ABC transporter permease [Euhalothece natronophila]|nr:ABC transporter permease [Euhalothece natronophila]